MITQAYLDKELKLAKRIFLFYTDKMLSYMTANSQKYDQWYRDSLQVEYLIGVLETMSLTSDGIRFGYADISDNIALLDFYKVREYYIGEIDSDTNTLLTPIIPVVPPGPYQPFMVDWKEIVITVEADATTVIPIPFDIDNIDFETLIISIEGAMNPIGIITNPATEEGFYISNNTLYWHNYYDLNKGDKIHFKYKQIKGVI